MLGFWTYLCLKWDLSLLNILLYFINDIELPIIDNEKYKFKHL